MTRPTLPDLRQAAIRYNLVFADPRTSSGDRLSYANSLATAVLLATADLDDGDDLDPIDAIEATLAQIKGMLTQLCYAAWSRGWEVEKP